MAGAKFHRFIMMEQERLSKMRFDASMAKIYNMPILAASLRLQCFFLERWLNKHRHILDEPVDEPRIPRE